ncbi:MAG: hypothetical protein ACREE1_08480 [Stellaceae bacterium]
MRSGSFGAARRFACIGLVVFLALAAACNPAAATVAGRVPGQIDSGNTAWVLAASALVLFMTLPGLALFYGGMAGSLLVAVFAMPVLGGVGYARGMGPAGQLGVQAAAAAALWSAVATWGIVRVLDRLIGIRVAARRNATASTCQPTASAPMI